MERQYKDSGIEWIGRIPEGWKIARVKNILKDSSLQSKTGKEMQLSVTQKYGIIKSSDIQVANPSISQVGWKLVKCGDIVFNKYKAHSGVFFVSPFDGIVTFNYSVYHCSEMIIPKYYEYLFKTPPCIGEFKKAMKGVGDSISPLYTCDLFRIYIMIPPLPEQQRIASYLDKKCGEIDALIALQEKMIAQLTEYKQAVITEAVTKGLDPNAKIVPSGIEWIGDVPEGWKVSLFKKGIRLLTDYTANGSFGDLAKNVDYLDHPDYSRLVRLTDLRENLKNNNGVWVSKNSHDYLSKSELYGGELLLANVGAYAGYACLMPKVDFICTLGPNMELIRCNDRLNNRYACYMLQSKHIFEHLQIIASSTAQPKLNKDNIRNIPVLFPPLPDQQRIASYLDTKCSEIDSLITLKRQKIESLNAYKKSVIYEAVTGKTMI